MTDLADVEVDVAAVVSTMHHSQPVQSFTLASVGEAALCAHHSTGQDLWRLSTDGMLVT